MTASDRYQSRFFNWFQHYSHQWFDKGTRALRHFKVAAEWTAQVVVYPLYWVFQSGRYISHEFQSHVSPWLTAPETEMSESDTPILEVLREAIQLEPKLTVSAPESETVWLPSSAYPMSQLFIQGIATDLESGQLVLVSNNNHCLDAIAEQHQETVKKAIARELANAAYQKRQQQHQTLPQFPLTTLAQRRDLFPPVRRFWQLMAWMEQGGVAVAIDSFGESQTFQDFSPQALHSHNINDLWSLSAELHPPTRFQQTSNPQSKANINTKVKAKPEKSAPVNINNVNSDLWLTSEDLFGAHSDSSNLKPTNNPINNPTSSSEPIPDYIETTATAEEYILSPAEKFFLWLDRLFLTVEEHLGKVLHWLNEEV